MLSRIFLEGRKAFTRMRRDRRDRRELGVLKRALPGFDSIETTAAAARRQLEPQWREYVGTVSSPVMAASLELSSLILAIARILGPKRILDLGSGFTSYVLRAYALENGGAATVVTVDDDALWLERTRAFLASRGLPTDQMRMWDDLSRASLAPFELVVHDLGNMSVRAAALPKVLELTDRQGVLVLDDIHHPKGALYRDTAPALCRRDGRRFVYARTLSLDGYGRHAAIALPR